MPEHQCSQTSGLNRSVSNKTEFLSEYYSLVIGSLFIADTETCLNDVKYPVQLTLICRQLVPIITPYESIFHLDINDLVKKK